MGINCPIIWISDLIRLLVIKYNNIIISFLMFLMFISLTLIPTTKCARNNLSYQVNHSIVVAYTVLRLVLLSTGV